jgi:predicted Rossmann fold nucleotide-binding protein DprA/Smf involved in DNA uptake
MQTTLVKNPSQKGVSPPAIRNIGVIGSRSLGFEYVNKVGQVVDDLLERGFYIASGGAIGTDQFCLERLISSGNSDKCSIFSAWKNYAGFPAKVRPFVREARQNGATLFWGLSQGKEPQAMVRMALLKRNERLVEACYGLVAFINAGSRGSVFTIKKAVKAHLPLVVFPVNCELPRFTNVKWVELRCGGIWDGGFKAVFLK